MKYTCIDTVEFLYPDVTKYESGTDRITILTPRGSYACAQIMLTDGTGRVNISCQGWDPEIYEMMAIPVESNERITEKNRAPFTPVREAPFYVYDCLKPYTGAVEFKDGICAVYFSMWIPADSPVGLIEGSVQVDNINIPVTIEISSAVVPEESLIVLMGYNVPNISRFHHVEKGTPEFEAMDTAYLKMLRRVKQNGLYCVDFDEEKMATYLGDNKWEFDFSEVEGFMNRITSLGFTRILYRLGWKRHWDEGIILVGAKRMPAMSLEGYCYLVQFLTALSAFLEEHGWTEYFLVSILDEPREVDFLEFRALSGLLRKYAPKLKLIDAIDGGDIHGALDIYVPCSSDFEKHPDVFQLYCEYGSELWFYDCSAPRGRGYINRFMDSPLIDVRYHGWGCYFYNMTGYLHWATNAYQPEQDPFVQSCPVHKNTDVVSVQPPGDTHIMYPGEDGPWMSVRLENQRAGTEEYEMLKMLGAKNKKLADSICHSVFRAFNDVERNPATFRKVREELIRAMEKL